MLLTLYRFLRGGTVALSFALGLQAVSADQNPAELRLVPFPKEVNRTSEQRFSLKAALQIHASAADKELLVTPLMEELQRAGFPEPQLIAVDSDESRFALVVRGARLDDPVLPEQADVGKSNVAESYAISVSPNGAVCRGKGNIGLYYAVQTLRQLIRANADTNGNIPCLTIRDWSSMKYRCFQDDWTRGPSPHLQTVFNQFELGSHLKHNMFTYYMENQFEFKKHPTLNPKDGTMMQEEFKQIVEYAAKQHLIVLGNQQSFGHHYKTLAVPEYTHLGEAGYILSPTVEEVYTFLDDLYSEILPLVPFEMFNVCCDETFDLAKSGASKELADEIGIAGVYVKHILRVRELLKKYDKRMLMWGDIIMNHPDKLGLIPKDVVMMCWDYAPRPDFDAFIKPFSESGYEFFVCPGQSNWSVILPLIRAYTVNIQNFVRDGCANGAVGMLNTGWEDDGESLHGYTWHAIAWGSECAWNGGKTDYKDFNRRIGAVLFGGENTGAAFADAIDTIAELQSQCGLTFNRVFWERDFIPRQSPATVERQAEQIVKLAQRAIGILKTTQSRATVNAELLDSFLLGAWRMKLIGERRLDGLEVSRRYAAASALDLTDPAQRKKALDELGVIIKFIDKHRRAHRAVETEFVRLWHNESKPYALDWTTRRYDELDAWFGDLQQKVQEVQKSVSEGGAEAALPDIGLVSSLLMRKTAPSRVMPQPLLPQPPWANPRALMRLGLTIEAGNVDRMTFPVELDLNLPESCVGKNVEAFVIEENKVPLLIPAQLDSANHPQNPNRQRLTLLLPGLAKEKTANVYVYFGLDNADTSIESLSTFDGDNGMKVIDNGLVQVHIGSEGGHVYRWLLKDRDHLDMTDPGDSSYHGFSDHGHADRYKRFDIVCMNKGPAMVRYGCFFEGELTKTLTVYAGLPLLDVITMYPTDYFWNFDDPDFFAADGQTPGTFLFSNGKTGATPVKGSNLQTEEQGVFWAVKTNEQGLAHGMVTPESLARFVIGPGGGMGGVGIERSESRSHFVTFAGNLAKDLSASTMEAIQQTYNLKDQPAVVQYAQEQPVR